MTENASQEALPQEALPQEAPPQEGLTQEALPQEGSPSFRNPTSSVTGVKSREPLWSGSRAGTANRSRRSALHY